MLDLKRLLRRKKTLSSGANTTLTSTTPPATSISQAPSAEATYQRDPPPYSASGNAQGQNGSTEPQLLDPTLNFTAAQIEQQWRTKDIVFARAIVQFIAERFDGRERGWGGYKYTYICDVTLSKRRLD